MKESPYSDLLKDPDFKRWVDNVRRGSATYGYNGQGDENIIIIKTDPNGNFAYQPIPARYSAQ